MSGLEAVAILAAVAGIVSAFQAARSLCAALRRAWREAREQIGRQKCMRRSLRVGERRIRHEFEVNFSRIGRRYAVGDEQGRSDLRKSLHILKHAVTCVLEQAIADRRLPDWCDLHASSEEAQTLAMDALLGQYQRLAQAAFISRPLRSRTLARRRAAEEGQLERQDVFSEDTWIDSVRRHVQRRVAAVMGTKHDVCDILAEKQFPTRRLQIEADTGDPPSVRSEWWDSNRGMFHRLRTMLLNSRTLCGGIMQADGKCGCAFHLVEQLDPTGRRRYELKDGSHIPEAMLQMLQRYVDLGDNQVRYECPDCAGYSAGSKSLIMEHLNTVHWPALVALGPVTSEQDTDGRLIFHLWDARPDLVLGSRGCCRDQRSIGVDPTEPF